MKRKKVIRVGMRVRSIYDGAHEFTIDKSLMPQRIFREKGSKRWWTKDEMVAICAPRNPGSYTPSQTSKQASTRRFLAFRGISEPLSAKTEPEYRFTCQECGIEFTRKRKCRPGQRPFCCDTHRMRNWKRANEIAKQKEKEYGNEKSSGTIARRGSQDAEVGEENGETRSSAARSRRRLR